MAIKTGLSIILLLGLSSITDATADTPSTAPRTSKDWTIKDGWNGVIPGKSTIAYAVKILGPAIYNKKEDHYFFWNGEVSVYVNAKTKVVEGLTIIPKEKDSRVPHTIPEAEKIFGPLPMTQAGKGGDRLWEKTGLEENGNDFRGIIP